MWRRIAAEHRFRFRLKTLLFLTLIVSAFPVFAQEPTWERLINSDREPQNWMSYGVFALPETSTKGAAVNGK